MPKKKYTRLRLILGDQLNRKHSWFRDTDPDTLYLIAEMQPELTYVKHHVQKICAFFLAMAAFADELRADGHNVLHLTLDSSDKFDLSALDKLIHGCIDAYNISVFEYQRADEYRLQSELETLVDQLEALGIECCSYDTEHFMVSHDALDTYLKKGSHNRMETFYRRLRKEQDILMKNGKPEGGNWNYDQDNRRKLKKDDLTTIPEPLIFANDASAVLSRLKSHNIDHFGHAQAELCWPIDRKQSLKLLRFFCDHLLSRFGDFQDAMTHQSEHAWSLFHSRLSFAMNTKMLSPREVIDRVIAHYEANKKTIRINQVEGFVRQILGWREYIRATYWVNMPGYTEHNKLNARRQLPDFFWTGKTGMNCLHHAIDQSLKYAYAHHIQRLMLTGNFCLLYGAKPDEVEAWYLGIYIDAIEWVESPNTRGMSLFADGGLIATKPYAGGGNYINKMSDYCRDCQYDVKDKTSDKACPFNALYWHFIDRHRERFEQNQRIGMIYRTWDKMDAQLRKDTLARADYCLTHADKL